MILFFFLIKKIAGRSYRLRPMEFIRPGGMSPVAYSCCPIFQPLCRYNVLETWNICKKTSTVTFGLSFVPILAFDSHTIILCKNLALQGTRKFWRIFADPQWTDLAMHRSVPLYTSSFSDAACKSCKSNHISYFIEPQRHQMVRQLILGMHLFLVLLPNWSLTLSSAAVYILHLKSSHGMIMRARANHRQKN